MSGEENPVFLFFLDCLGYEEAQENEFLSSTLKGRVPSKIPRVTPYVISSVMTGKEPTDSGILCPTRLGKPNLVRPLTETFFETLSKDRRVLNYEMPFTMNLQGMFLTNIGSAPQVIQQQRPGQLMIPRSGGEMWKEDKESLLQGHVDYVRGVMSTMRNLARNGVFDAFFTTIRNIDSFGHFYFKSQRERLMQYVDLELREFLRMAEDMDAKMFWFSDHGAREKKEAFYINKWLEEKGYLKTKVLYNKLEKQQEQQKEQGQDAMAQISLHSPFCEVSKDSQACSPDAYDSGVKILDGSLDIETLKDELMGTGFYESVTSPQELYGEGEYDNDTLGIDLVCDRGDGILVTGNVHKALDGVRSKEVGDVHCQGEIRSGVHTRYGAWGTNDSVLNKIDLEPVELHDIIEKFVKRNAPKPGIEKLYGTDEIVKGEEAEMRDRLEELGYI